MQMREKLLKALTVYVARGREALALLGNPAYRDSQDDDRLLATLNRREAAYHNFRALDHLASQSGFDIGTDEEGRKLGLEAAQQTELLAARLREGSESRRALLARLNGARRGLAGYRSGGAAPAKLVKLA